jgi:bifunctional ADP-heptose synthase (sugar kinase/adenylyltransferase)
MTNTEKTINSQHILVIGDFMLDREWILSGLPLPTVQSHSQVKPMQRIHPTWDDNRLGGAGMTLMALKTLCEKKDLNYSLHGIGLWNENDETLFQQLAGDEIRVKLHRLKIKTEMDSGKIVTSIKSRFYTQLAEEQPKLFNRFDQDPEPDPNLPPHKSNIFDDDPLQEIKAYFNAKNIQLKDIKAVVIADFNKGVAQSSVLDKLKEYLNENQDVLWFIDSKNPQILDIIPAEQPIHVLTMNREEAVRLHSKVTNDQKIFSIPEGRQPGIELLSLIKGLSTQKDKQIEKIVIKLDKEGACLYVNQQPENEQNTFLCQPEKSLESDGIAAGDFFNASFLLSILSSCDNQTNLHDSCIDASEWLKLNQEYWANKKFREDNKSDVVKAEFLNLKSKEIEEKEIEEIKSKINQKKNWDNQAKFNLDEKLKELEKLFNYELIIKDDDPTIVLANAKGFLGDFASTDPSLREKVRDFVDLISQYTKKKGKARPLNCLVTARPGSGKSFFAKQVAIATGCQMIEVNCSQMTSSEDLLKSISQLNDVKDKLPLLFLDEVDTDSKYYPFLLAPLWDASVLVNGKTIKWSDRFVSILVASESNFLESLMDEKTKKGSDLLSRLNGPRLTLSEPDLTSKRENERKQILTSRVYLAADTLLRYHDTARIIECGLLDLVYCAKEFNPRSLEHFITSLPTPADGIVTLRNIPSYRLKEFAESFGYKFKEGSADDIEFKIPHGQANLKYRYQNSETLTGLHQLETKRIRLIQKH